MKKNIRYKPSKLNSAMTFVVGILFVILGLTVVIPMTFQSGFLPGGIFGLVWTGGAAAMTVVHGLYLFGKRDHVDFFGRYEITDEDPSAGATPTFQAEASDHQHITASGLNVKGRLEQLEALKGAGLLTQEEYDQKHRDILKDL